jgi:AraC-like DNA-binding protein
MTPPVVSPSTRVQAMDSAAPRNAPIRQTAIGRLGIDVISGGPRMICGSGRAESIRDASYLLVIPRSGYVTFSQGGRIGTAGAGEYVLLSEMAFYELSSQARSDLLIVRIPATELRGRMVSVEDHVSRRFKANEHMTRLLVDLIRSVAELFLDRAPPNPQALATEIISFVALTIGAEDRGAATDVRNARYQLRRRIVDFIEKNLSDQDLSPKKIAASSRISLSYLYSLFNDDETTVGQFVQVKRLQRAYEILVADPRGHRTVAEVAYEVGFKNVSHFSRSFSRHFSIAPRDARQMNGAHAADPARPAQRDGELVVAGNVASHPSFGAPYWDAERRRALQDTL